jgi:hypothetical protein
MELLASLRSFTPKGTKSCLINVVVVTRVDQLSARALATMAVGDISCRRAPNDLEAKVSGFFQP